MAVNDPGNRKRLLLGNARAMTLVLTRIIMLRGFNPWKFVLAVAMPFVSAACFGKPDRAEVHYRVTVLVDDHGVERRGSAVWGFALTRPLVALDSPYSSKFSADAVPVKLRDGGVLFLLLQGWFPENPPQAARSPGTDAGNLVALLFRHHLAYQGPDEIERLVAMEHSKIKTGRLICPQTGVLKWEEPQNSRVPTAAYCFRLAYSHVPEDKRELKAFDPACAYFKRDCVIHIKSVTVQLTDEPVTRPLKSVLPWMKGEYDFSGRIDGMAAGKLGLPEEIFVMRS